MGQLWSQRIISDLQFSEMKSNSVSYISIGRKAEYSFDLTKQGRCYYVYNQKCQMTFISNLKPKEIDKLKLTVEALLLGSLISGSCIP